MLRYVVVLFVMLGTAVLMAMLSFERDLPPLPDDPQNRGTFTYADTTDPGSLDPGKTSASIDFRVLKCLYQTLMVYEHGGENLEPGVAESYELSEDGKTYTFHLRDNAKWSNGDPVTASDFVYAWRRTMMFETGADYASLFYLIEGAEEFFNWRGVLLNYADRAKVVSDQDKLDAFLARNPGLEALSKKSAEEKWALTLERFEQSVGVKALDERTLQVKLVNPTPYFIELCAFPSFSPVPAKVIEANTLPMAKDGSRTVDSEYWGDKDRVVSNGPYHLILWQNKRRLVMDQNPHYWDRDRMGNLRVVMRVVPDESLALAQFRDGQLDWITQLGAPQLRSKLVNVGYEHAHAGPRAGVYYYQFNCREEQTDGRPNPMSDPLVRRALGMCIDRSKIVQSVTRNGEPQATTFVPVGSIPTYDSPLESGLTYDPATARELLAQAGYPDGEGFPAITLLINVTGTSGNANSDIALVIKKSWEEQLNLPNVNIEMPEFQVYLERSNQGDYNARRAGWFGDYRDPTTWLDMLRSQDSNNDSGYNNPAYDKLLADAAVEVDPQRRMEILREAEALLMQDAPIVPLYFYMETTIYDKQKTDLRPNPWSNLRLDLIPVQRDEDQ